MLQPTNVELLDGMYLRRISFYYFPLFGLECWGGCYHLQRLFGEGLSRYKVFPINTLERIKRKIYRETACRLTLYLREKPVTTFTSGIEITVPAFN